MKGLFVIGMILLGVLLIVFGPLLTIWSLNTLFGLSIAYTLKTWFAAFILSGVVGGARVSSSNKR